MRIETEIYKITQGLTRATKPFFRELIELPEKIEEEMKKEGIIYESEEKSITPETPKKD